MRFRDVIACEFERRRRLNARYSLRGFARALGVHHATLSRLLRQHGRIHSRTMAVLGPRLGLSCQQLQTLAGNEDVAAVRQAIQRPAFRPDSRRLASLSGISIDRVNIALESLLRSGQLRMIAADRWVLAGHEGVDRP